MKSLFRFFTINFATKYRFDKIAFQVRVLFVVCLFVFRPFLGVTQRKKAICGSIFTTHTLSLDTCFSEYFFATRIGVLWIWKLQTKSDISILRGKMLLKWTMMLKARMILKIFRERKIQLWQYPHCQMMASQKSGKFKFHKLNLDYISWTPQFQRKHAMTQSLYRRKRMTM